MHAYFEEHLAETDRLLADNDRRGFYKHLKGTVGLGGRKAQSEQFIMDKDGTLPKDKVRILERWAGYFGTLLNTELPKLDPAIGDLFPQRPSAPSLGDELTVDERTAVTRGMPNSRAVGPDSLPSELLKIDHLLSATSTTYLSMCGERETSPSSGEMQPLRSFIKRRIDLIVTISEGFRSLPIQEKCC